MSKTKIIISITVVILLIAASITVYNYYEFRQLLNSLNEIEINTINELNAGKNFDHDTPFRGPNIGAPLLSIDD